jgi:hypothetical protein
VGLTSVTLGWLPELPAYRCIALTQGQYAFVDASDFEELNQYPWFARWNPEAQTFYASRTITGNKTIHMHNVIVPPRRGKIVDHWNGCGLDNRRVNLRRVTRRVNAINRKIKSTNTSSCTGIKCDKRTGKWFATWQVAGRRIYSPYFERKEDAVAARLAGESRYYKDAGRTGAPIVPPVIIDPISRAKRVSNTSGFEGVGLKKRPGTKVWRARVGRRTIGHFDSPEKASRAREEFIQNQR